MRPNLSTGLMRGSCCALPFRGFTIGDLRQMSMRVREHRTVETRLSAGAWLNIERSLSAWLDDRNRKIKELVPPAPRMSCRSIVLCMARGSSYLAG